MRKPRKTRNDTENVGAHAAPTTRRWQGSHPFWEKKERSRMKAVRGAFLLVRASCAVCAKLVLRQQPLQFRHQPLSANSQLLTTIPHPKIRASTARGMLNSSFIIHNSSLAILRLNWGLNRGSIALQSRLN